MVYRCKWCGKQFEEGGVFLRRHGIIGNIFLSPEFCCLRCRAEYIATYGE